VNEESMARSAVVGGVLEVDGINGGDLRAPATFGFKLESLRR
jgi:hypothetical protein